MKICGRDETLECAVQLYVQQRSFGKVYIFPVSACRKPFMLIVSERERMKLRLSAKDAFAVIGSAPGDEGKWRLAKKYARLKTECKQVMRSLLNERLYR
jgi:hypothetical protein|nr:MAG TPA: hypothetical protein [Caudoviricetes sp.]DAS99204.1 MAG TPA: hypothetical protein [Caudoviricetes sp.]